MDGITALARTGAPFDQVEAAIDAVVSEREDRAALWLLAWSLRATTPGRRQDQPVLKLVSSG